MMHDRPWLYDGPAESRSVVERALRWVVDPASGLDVMARGLVRTISVDERMVRVRLAPPEGGAGLAAVIAEDAEAELFDHFRGQRRVVVMMVPDRPGDRQARPTLRRVA